MSTTTTPPGVEVLGDVSGERAEILTPDALALVAKLVRAFAGRRAELLAKRVERAAALDAGKRPDFLARDRRHPRRRLDHRAGSRTTCRTAASRSPARSTAR